MTKLYLKEVNLLKPYLLSILVLLLLSYSIFFILNDNQIIVLGSEDGFFEYLTSFFLFVSSLTLFFSSKKNFFLISLSVILFFGAGEEISWGQRILGFSTPKGLKDVNVQGESTIHNIEIFSRENFDRSYKKGIKNFITIDNMYRMFMVLFGIVLPFVVFHSKKMTEFARKIKLPIPPVTIGAFFIISWLCLKLIPVIVKTTNDTDVTAAEIFEFMTSYVWLMISLYFFRNRKVDILGYDLKLRFP